MTSPPRRLRPDGQQRQHTINHSTRVQTGGGGVRAARPVTTPSRVAGFGSGSVRVVEHGDDPNVSRPAVAWVLWVGAADPVNALDYDGRYPVTL